MKYQILTGNNCDVLKQFPDNHFDSIVTDPPYGIDFLGKAWDANTGALETYQECLRVLKPGGHILAFSAARTYHHLAITLEQAGFEIRDQIMWIYSSGFPKSQDIGKSIDRAAGKKNNLKRHDSDKKDNNGLDLGSGVRCPECGKDSAARYVCDKGQDCGMVYKPQTEEGKQWSGWGTQLKPAHEPIALARKPIKLSIVKNAQKWGTGALNINATRVPYDDPAEAEADAKWRAKWGGNQTGGAPVFQGTEVKKKSTKPAISKMGTTAHDNYNAEKNADQGLREGEQLPWIPSNAGRFPSNVIGEIPDYQKYFYCPKVSRAERHIGFDDPGPLFPGMSRVEVNMGGLTNSSDKNKTNTRGNVEKTSPGNNHPTVKPIELMKYLIKLVTPAGGRVLDPFNGSGSTGCAAVELGYDYTGIELDLKYVDIARKRIQAWYEHTHPTDPLVASGLFEQC